MNPIITTLIIIGIVLLVIAAVVLYIRWKLSTVTRKYLNMNLKQKGTAPVPKLLN